MQFVLEVPSDVCIKITPQKPLSRELPQKQISFYTFAINSTRLLSGKLLCVVVSATKMSTNKNKNSNCTSERENGHAQLEGKSIFTFTRLTHTHTVIPQHPFHSLFVLFLGIFFLLY